MEQRQLARLITWRSACRIRPPQPDFFMEKCANCHSPFTITPEDRKFYKKINVPKPTFCPSCRMQRRMSFRNERSLYSRSCDLCKTDIIAAYKPEATHPVYCPECWWSDKWDPKDHGRDFDFCRPFFEEFKELKVIAKSKGFLQVSSSPLTRSSYHADKDFSKLKKNRINQINAQSIS